LLFGGEQFKGKFPFPFLRSATKRRTLDFASLARLATSPISKYFSSISISIQSSVHKKITNASWQQWLHLIREPEMIMFRWKTQRLLIVGDMLIDKKIPVKKNYKKRQKNPVFFALYWFCKEQGSICRYASGDKMRQDNMKEVSFIVLFISNHLYTLRFFTLTTEAYSK
jgi:hypothetical protein